MIQSVNQVRILKTLQLFTCFILISSIATAQSKLPKIEAEERMAVVDRISELIIENYVFLDVAEKSAAQLQKQLESGAYDKLEDAESFAKKLTEDLQSINHDKHMRVRVHRTNRVRTDREDPEVARARRERRSQKRTMDLKK